jgi:prepilin-type N-terminal cleavage/methylation domain-containing protein
MNCQISPASRRASRRGFTLIELGIVIGVTAILAAAIVPDIIETMRNRMAEKSAVDVTALHDSARLFFAQNTARPRRWPGETASGQCSVGWAFANFKVDMISGGYLATGGAPNDPFNTISGNFLLNPWGHAYDVGVYAPPGAATPACLFSVSTFVPTSVENAFTAFLPQATCGAGCPRATSGANPPAGFSRCCSFAAKPGAALLTACGDRMKVGRNTTTNALECQLP